MTNRWPWLSTAFSAAALAAAVTVFCLSALGRFRSMSGFPLIFAIAVALGIVVSLLVDRGRGRRARAWLGIATLIVAALAPVAQERVFRADRKAREARGMEVLSDRPAPEIPYLAAIGPLAVEPVVFASTRRVTLLNFWATWCNPCVEEIPLLEAFWREHRELDFELVGVTRPYGELDAELASIRDLLSRLDVSYPIVIESDESPGHAAYLVESFPTSVLIEDGRVVGYGAGLDGTQRVLRQAKDLLEGEEKGAARGFPRTAPR